MDGSPSETPSLASASPSGAAPTGAAAATPADLSSAALAADAGASGEANRAAPALDVAEELSPDVAPEGTLLPRVHGSNVRTAGRGPRPKGPRRARRSEGPQRIDLACEDAGFAAPPCLLHLRVLPAEGGPRRVLVRTAPARLHLAQRWLERYAPSGIRKGAGLAPAVLAADFAALPPPWAKLLDDHPVESVTLTPAGVAAFFLDGSLAQVDRFVQVASNPLTFAPPHVRTARTPELHRPSSHQLDALATAVALGYYDIPRRIDLRTLARRMGIGLGSVAELLRRAEELVVTSFVDATARRAWDDDASQIPAGGEPVQPHPQPLGTVRLVPARIAAPSVPANLAIALHKAGLADGPAAAARFARGSALEHGLVAARPEGPIDVF